MVSKLLALACAVLLCASLAWAQGPGAFNLGEIYSSSGRTVFDNAIQSSSANPATSGFLRLANSSDRICWRNAGNTADICIYLDNSNVLQLPTVNASNGGTLSGTFAGSPTFSGNPTFSGSPVLSGSLSGAGVQGTDTKLLTAGTISGTGTALCTDANGGATTSGCSPSTVNQGARVYATGQLGVPTGTVEALPFNATRFNNGPMWSTSNSTRLTAQVAGTYLISGSINWTAVAGGYRLVWIRLNGAGPIAEQINEYQVSSDQIPQTVTTIWHMNAGDYVELVVEQTSGGTMDITSSGNYSPEFSAEYVGP